MADHGGTLQQDLSGYPELLKPKDVQAILRVSQYRAYRLFHSKGFPSVTLGISGLFIPKARLMVWLGYGLAAYPETVEGRQVVRSISGGKEIVDEFVNDIPGPI